MKNSEETRARFLVAAIAVVVAALLAPAQSPAVIRMNFHGSGVFSRARWLVLTRTEEPDAALAVTSDPQQAPGTIPSVVVLTCVKTEPIFGEIIGDPPPVFVPGTRLYAGGYVQGDPGRHVLIQAVDGGVFGPNVLGDSAAVEFTDAVPGGARCGAGGLALEPLTAGNFVGKPLW